MATQRLYALGFQLAKLVWPPVVLGDVSWLMTWPKQDSQRIQCAVPTVRNPHEFLVATERVGTLGVDLREVFDLKLDTGNFGPLYDDLNETALRMCYCETFHDGCACGDVVRALFQCDAPGRWRVQAEDKWRELR